MCKFTMTVSWFIQNYLSINVIRFSAGKTKNVGEASHNVTHSVRLFISLVVTSSHLFLFAFVWKSAYRFTNTYYEYIIGS